MPEIPLVMPKMSMTMTEGILVAWHKQPGDAVRSGDVVCEVTTDKVDMEVESPIDGVLARLVAEPEDVVPVGEPIGYLTSETDDLLGDLLDGPPKSEPAAEPDPVPAEPDPVPAEPDPVPAASAPEPDAPTLEPEAAGVPVTTPVPVGAGPAAPADRASEPVNGAPVNGAQGNGTVADRGWIESVPLARARADALHVDLAGLTGSGPGGVVRVADVEAAARSGSKSAAPSRPVPVTSDAPTAGRARTSGAERRRAALARKMTESATVPQFVVFRDLDLETLAAVRDGVSWTAVLLTAFAAVLRDDPVLHARWAGERPQPHDEVVVSVAVDAPDGLLAPSLTAPDRMSLREVDAALRALAARAQAGRLSVADLTPGTTTVSNLGGMGVDTFTVLLTPPQATALSLGAVAPVPVAVPGGIGVRVRCRAGLAVDHRVADGADAARILQRLQDRLADPGSLGLP